MRCRRRRVKTCNEVRVQVSGCGETGEAVLLLLQRKGETTVNPFSRIEVTLGSCYCRDQLQLVYPGGESDDVDGVFLHQHHRGFNRSYQIVGAAAERDGEK